MGMNITKKIGIGVGVGLMAAVGVWLMNNVEISDKKEQKKESLIKQEVSTVSGIEITIPLKSNPILTFSNIELCVPTNSESNKMIEQVKSGEYKKKINCSYNGCEVIIKSKEDGSLPKSVGMNVKDDGNCNYVDIESRTARKTATGYSGVIELTQQIKSLLGLNQNVKLKAKYASNASYILKNKVETFNVNYKHEPVREILIVNGKEVAKINFK